ncbi:hypothetical protein, partial [Planktothrix sp.]|uniref:rolling circle replication-associated protein n=3 Tax=Planktothrix sp. TaxID=3088171 RepID=UPI0038D4210B
KPLEYLRIQGFANNELRFTVRSKSLGPSRVHLLNESQLVGRKKSRRNNSYGDRLPQKLKNRADRLKAFLMWLCQVEKELGWHSCPVPDIFSYIPPSKNYTGKPIKSERLRFAVYPDGSMSAWDGDDGEQVANFHVATAKERIERLLVITNELQEKPRKSCGIGFDNPRRIFTKRARHKLLEAGEVVQDLCPTSDSLQYAANFRAITLTLPGSTQEAYRALAAYSSWLINRLLQTVRDAKFKIHYFGVWELQKRGALHVHLGIGANPEDASMEELEELGNKIAKKWFKLLKEMSTTEEISRGGKKGRLPGIDMFELSPEASAKNGGIKTWRDRPDVWKWDNLPIKKNVAAYFSKYTSKNVDSGNKKKAFEHYCPSRWWFMGKAISDEIKARRFDYTVAYHPVESNQLIEDVLEVWPSICQYSYDFRIIAKHEENGNESSLNIVNGITKIYYWDRSVFKDVHQVLKDLKTTFSETGRLREIKDKPPNDFRYYKFYANNAPCSEFPTVEPLVNKRIVFKNIPLSNDCIQEVLTPVDTYAKLMV